MSTAETIMGKKKEREGGGERPRGTLRRSYQRIVAKRLLLLGAMTIAVLVSVVVDVGTGVSDFPFSQIMAGLFEPESLNGAQRVILFDVRLPFSLMALAVGGALGLSGAETQTVLNNPLASPYTLGISGAAILGATLVIVTDVSIPGLGSGFAIPMAAFVASALASLLILALSLRFGSNTETIILFGIALLFCCTACISLLQFVAEAEDVQESVLWGMGSLTRSTWPGVAAVAATLALVVPFSLKSAWSLTLVRCGDEQAKGAGVSLRRLRLTSLLRSSLLAAMAVSFVGAVGFVGLVGPHVARLLLGEDQRFYLPGSLIAGALMLSLASIVSKLIVPGIIIPVGIVTSLVGIPIFVALILFRRRGA